jgi:hypothetical protein
MQYGKAVVPRPVGVTTVYMSRFPHIKTEIVGLEKQPISP